MEILALSAFESVMAVLGLVGLGIATYGVLRRKKSISSSAQKPESDYQTEKKADLKTSPAPVNQWLRALQKTSSRFGLGTHPDVQSMKEDFEEACLISDLGVNNTQEALGAINWTELADLDQSKRTLAAKQALSKAIAPWLNQSDSSNQKWPEQRPAGPTVLWFIGVNGVGKTTSIAKLAHELKARGHSVMLAAGDTFRAAAGEQLEEWARRLEIPIVRGQEGSDSSAVLFDASQSAKAKGIDFLLCDSAGRLHNQGQLMEALAKNRRVLDKAIPGSPHETLLVLDANTGQNMLKQAEQFLDKVGVTGLILTKLDGTARGGAVVAVARQFKLPIRRIGLGEQPKDFIAFSSRDFSQALFNI